MKSILIILFLFPFIAASGQQLTGTVYGKSEDNNKEPLPGVNLYWAGTDQGTVSDESGQYILQRTNDNSLLVASFIGFSNDTLEVNKDQAVLDIVLSSLKELDEVVITEKQGSSFVSQISPLHVQNITSAELQKAACCNLSESFETNASVDVSYSDAVTGARKIELLGLHGKYVQMMTENLPNLRGLSTTYGLGYIPGSWMESIQVSKGTSTVVNGYESTTGQINVEFKKPDNSEKLYLNAYANHFGKVEGNFNTALRISDKWSTMLFGHGETFQQKMDPNGDSFLDAPLVNQYNLYNRWKYVNGDHMAQIGIKALEEDRMGGQVDFSEDDEQGSFEHYGINIHTKRFEIWGKTGYAFKNWAGTSIAFLNSYTYHDQSSYFGKNIYQGTEKNYYANLIFQSQIGSCNHKYNAGVSYMYDEYREVINATPLNRTENVPGVFFQYTYSNERNLTLLAGIRSDFHNIYGTFFTPRMHIKYKLSESIILRSSAGKGYRTANVIAENSSILASSRALIMADNLRQEEAWNYGINLTKIFYVGDRELNLNVEYYRTEFINQVVIDRDQSVSEVHIYNLDGQSFSNNYQLEATYELIRRLDLIAAFRYSDVQMTTNGVLQREPLVNRYKGLLNLSYKTRHEEWQFDFTTQLNGDARLPGTQTNPVEYQRPEKSPVYTIINAQVTRYFNMWNVYAGVENLTGFTQSDPVIAADDPFGEYFDSSLVWGPIMGRKIYVGVKFQLN
jgi:outer membrane receptor for ferrienterochelin and colicin